LFYTVKDNSRVEATFSVNPSRGWETQFAPALPIGQRRSLKFSSLVCALRTYLCLPRGGCPLKG
jgi:hypothetical protein